RGHQRGRSAQGFGGKLERGAGAGGRFVEEQGHAFAAQQLRRAAGIHAPGQRQNRFNLRSSKLFDAQQRTQLRLHWPSPTRSINSTLSEPSVSCNFNSMNWLVAVWMVRPTKPASMGNSRWPRSISAQS